MICYLPTKTSRALLQVQPDLIVAKLAQGKESTATFRPKVYSHGLFPKKSQYIYSVFAEAVNNRKPCQEPAARTIG